MAAANSMSAHCREFCNRSIAVKALLWIGLIAVFASVTVNAQTGAFPSATRIVFKCSVDGKTVYSDQPCLGAQRLEITPTRGMNKSTGKELSGADVSSERRHEMFVEAVKPLTGLDQQQYATTSKRTRLSTEGKSECAMLDRQIAQAEINERSAPMTDKTEMQRALLNYRTRHRAGGC